MTLTAWSALFLIAYLGAMLAFGAWAQRRLAGADDFATARGRYGPVLLAVAFASTTASGATYLGIPALSYQFGLAAFWLGIIYPLSIYFGVYLTQKLIARYGNRRGHRSIPEFLGDRYQSEALRLVSALYSLVLIFFLAAQLVAGLVMFEMLLGLGKAGSLALTAAVLTAYVALGGAHADILTDGLQGFLMLLISLLVVVLFVTGFGVDGGMPALIDGVTRLEPGAWRWLNPELAIVATPWALAAMFIAYLPFGLLPHVGNKLWALKNERDRTRFIVIAFVIALIFPLVTVGGLHARAVLGDDLLMAGGNANAALPALFIEIFPPWLAALLGAAILSAIMSTTDGLVLSTSQVFANDIYRRSLAPRLHAHRSESDIDRTCLAISRWATALVMIGAAVLAWHTVHINVVLITWIGLGGMISATTGPLVLGLFWRGITRAGALAGFVAGAATFIALHGGLLLPDAPDSALAGGLAALKPNPYACALGGQAVGLLFTTVISMLTPPLPPEHLEEVFGPAGD
ncbi:MAG: sodium:solute symporter [Gammaproteobacteria bacterium]|nr:sodium:solute symporter [Gammaproteobacteria bacterium]